MHLTDPQQSTPPAPSDLWSHIPVFNYVPLLSGSLRGPSVLSAASEEGEQGGRS